MSSGVRLSVWLAATLLFAAPAQAGSYDVLACDAAPSGANNSWDYETNEPNQLQSDTQCPPSGLESGLHAETKFLAGTPGACQVE